MKKKKIMAITSICLAIISLIPIVVLPESVIWAEVTILFSIILSIISIVLGIIGKSESKGIAIMGIVIAVISCVLLFFSLTGVVAISKSTDCVDNGDGTSTCKFFGQDMENIPNSMLTEEQMAK